VAPVKLFLDLVSFPVRGPEGAAALLRSELAKSLRLDTQDVDRVSAFLETL
jgi:hypothetical protein